MYLIKMMNGDSFKISQETFNRLTGESGLVYVSEIKGIINLNSVSSVLPQEMAESIGNRRRLHDGSYAIYKHGAWVDERDQSVKINLHYYPELAKDAESINKQLN
jgi:hypothetical protein